MVKVNITIKARDGEEAGVSVDPSKTISLLLRKAMREISSGDDIIGFKGPNGEAIDEDTLIQAVRDMCGDMLIALYEGEEAVQQEEEEVPPVEEEAPVQVEQPPQPPPAKVRAPKPVPRSAPAGRRSSSGGGGGTTFEIKAQLSGHTKQVSALAFSTSDPTLLATGGYDNKVVIWDIGGHQRGGGAVRGELTGHSEAVTCITFNPTVPGVLASSSGDETIKVWDLPSHSETSTLSGGHNDWVKGACFNPEVSSMLASVSDDGNVLIWDTNTGSVKKKLKGGHSDFVTSCAFSPHDSNVLATSSTDKTVIVWNSATGKKIYTFDDFGDEVHTVAWSPAAEMVLAAGCFDCHVRVYDASSDDGGGELFKTLVGHKSEVNKVAFSPTGVLASCSDDSTVIIWDMDSERPLQVLSGAHNGLVSCVAWSPLDSNLLATGGEDGKVVVWATGSSKLFAGGGGGAPVGDGGSSRGSNTRAAAGGGGGSSAEIGSMRQELNTFREEVKKDMKDLSKSMAQVKATVDHILALMSINNS